MRYLLCVWFCLFFCSTHGQIDGDPAPGRSPGPPPTVRPSSVPATTHRSHKPLITTTSADDDDDDADNDASIHVVHSPARHTHGDDSWENETNPARSDTKTKDDHGNPISSLDNNETTQTDVEHISFDLESHPVDGHQQQFKSSCSGASLYINPSESIHRDYAGAVGSDELPLRLEVTHSLFDTRHGLTNQIIYNGEHKRKLTP